MNDVEYNTGVVRFALTMVGKFAPFLIRCCLFGKLIGAISEVMIVNEDEWLVQLRNLYDVDKAQHQANKQSQARDTSQETADAFMRRCKAHALMRQVQRTLLNGEGALHFYENVGGYDRAVVLMWRGPISAASKPAKIEDVNNAIIVGANDRGIFVNDEELAEPSPAALRQALLALARRFVEE